MGWTEAATLPDHELKFTAKLDTGADTASLNVYSLATLRKQGREYVRIALLDDVGRTGEMTLPVVRRVRVKRIGAPSVERPVVRLRVCLAGVTLDAEFTLTSRQGFSRQMLVGRNILAGRFLVDAASQFLAAKQCPGPIRK